MASVGMLGRGAISGHNKSTLTTGLFVACVLLGVCMVSKWSMCFIGLVVSSGLVIYFLVVFSSLRVLLVLKGLVWSSGLLLVLVVSSGSLLVLILLNFSS